MGDERVRLSAIEDRFTTVGGDVGWVKATERDAMTRALRLAEKALGEADELAEAGLDPGDRICSALNEIRALIDFAPPSPPRGDLS